MNAVKISCLGLVRKTEEDMKEARHRICNDAKDDALPFLEANVAVTATTAELSSRENGCA